MRRFLTAVFILCSVCAYSQKRLNASSKLPSICGRYGDSIAVVKAITDTANIETGTAEHCSKYMPLFVPMTYHTDIVARRFSLSDEDAAQAERKRAVDDALLGVYLRRPDLVKRYVNDDDARRKQPFPKAEKMELPSLTDVFDPPDIEEQTFEPVDLLIEKPNFWTLTGEFYLQAVQNYYSANWYQGLESNYSWLAKVSFQANYNNKQKVTWENKLEMNLGFQTDKSDEIHKVRTSEDLLRYTSLVGLQATKKWYYAFQAIASTQFMRSFPSNSYEISSAFLSPLSVNASLGMSYKVSLMKEKLTGTVYLSPAALGFKYVDRPSLAEANGIEEGKHSNIDFGYTFTIEGTWNFNDYISWKTRLYGYSPYDRIELQWENSITVKAGKFIALTVYAYPRFDDSPGLEKDKSYGYFQLKEYTSFGITYSF